MPTSLSVLDGLSARRWFEHALRSLLLVRGDVDELNVFPVPDADTGTNLVLTLAAAAEATRELPADADLGALTGRAADGALLGARGSSGVILSQALQAIALEQAGREQMDGPGLAASLRAAAEGARSAVGEPVEGTILTVADAAAEAARAAAGDRPEESSADRAALAVVARAAVDAARTALAGTHGSHGGRSVDAGAAGYVVVLGALLDVVTGQEGGSTRSAALDRALAADPADARASEPAAVHEHAAGEFEVMYVLRAGAEEAAALRRRLAEVGHAVAVVGQDRGGDGLWHVHVHTDHPASALADPGAMRQVGVRRLPEAPGPQPPATFGVVACTRAPGLLAPLARTGAVAVLEADPAGVRRAIEDLATGQVLVLPCDDASARAAAGLPGARAPHRPHVQVHVASTRDDVQVLTAATELVVGAQGASGTDDRVTVVDRAVGAVRTHVVVDAPTVTDLERVVAGILTDPTDILTAVVGAELGEEHRETLREAAEAAGAELVLVDGGQRRPALLLGAE